MPKFLFTTTGEFSARMHGYVEIEAADQAAAEKVAVEIKEHPSFMRGYNYEANVCDHTSERLHNVIMGEQFKEFTIDFVERSEE